MAKEKKESAPRKTHGKTTKIHELKYMLYNGVQMSRKMWKLWNIDKIVNRPEPKAKRVVKV